MVKELIYCIKSRKLFENECFLLNSGAALGNALRSVIKCYPFRARTDQKRAPMFSHNSWSPPECGLGCRRLHRNLILGKDSIVRTVNFVMNLWIIITYVTQKASRFKLAQVKHAIN